MHKTVAVLPSGSFLSSKLYKLDFSHLEFSFLVGCQFISMRSHSLPMYHCHVSLIAFCWYCSYFAVLKFLIHDQDFYNLYAFVFISMIWISNRFLRMIIEHAKQTHSCIWYITMRSNNESEKWQTANDKQSPSIPIHCNESYSHFLFYLILCFRSEGILEILKCYQRNHFNFRIFVPLKKMKTKIKMENRAPKSQNVHCCLLNYSIFFVGWFNWSQECQHLNQTDNQLTTECYSIKETVVFDNWSKGQIAQTAWVTHSNQSSRMQKNKEEKMKNQPQSDRSKSRWSRY